MSEQKTDIYKLVECKPVSEEDILFVGDMILNKYGNFQSQVIQTKDQTYERHVLNNRQDGYIEKWYLRVRVDDELIGGNEPIVGGKVEIPSLKEISEDDGDIIRVTSGYAYRIGEAIEDSVCTECFSVQLIDIPTGQILWETVARFVNREAAELAVKQLREASKTNILLVNMVSPSTCR